MRIWSLWRQLGLHEILKVKPSWMGLLPYTSHERVNFLSLLSPTWGCMKRNGLLQPTWGLLLEPDHGGALILDVLLPELWEINCLKATQPIYSIFVLAAELKYIVCILFNFSKLSLYTFPLMSFIEFLFYKFLFISSNIQIFYII